jgi:ubiquinone/menaquinone biosynthesis C-methylase UbiE
MSKGNKTQNWNNEYKHLEVTYKDKEINNRNDFVLDMLYELIIETISNKINIFKSFKTLECGCGGARISVYLAKHGADVTCIDSSPEAIRLARNNFVKEGASCSLFIGNVNQLPFHNNSFDVVMSYGLLEHFVDINRPFNEMTRVLKKRGVSIHTIIPKKYSLWTLAHIWNFAIGVSVHLRDKKLNGIIKNSRRNFPHFENTYTKRQYLIAMGQAGLTDCSITGTSIWVPFNLPKRWESTILKIAVQKREFFKKFDRSKSVMTDILAPVYFSVGKKS